MLLIYLSAAITAAGQDLPRQGNWGIYVQELTDSVKVQNQYTGNGVEIIYIVPGSEEDRIGLQAGDILTTINTFNVVNISDVYFSGYFSDVRAGDQIKYHIIRKGEKLERSGKVVGKPYEKHPNAEVIYDKVAFVKGHLRTIITKPKSAKKVPAIYFIPGYNCASYDNMNPIHPYKKIIDSLTNLGYAVFRCEKSGMGDSYATANCFQIDFETEQFGFENGYQKLLSYDFVDPDQIFIFGHSLGGINAPLMAEKYPVKGVIVYGTTHLPWMEYLQDMLRFQNPKLGIPPLEMEEDMKLYQSLLYEHYVKKSSPQALIESNPGYIKLLQRDFQYIGGNMIFQRHYTFMQQLNDLNLAKTWASLECHVLSVFGEADFEALNSNSHQEIVEIVNKYHPGKGTFLELPETNHAFIKVGSMEDEIKSKLEGTGGQLMATHFNYAIVTQIDSWIKGLD